MGEGRAGPPLRPSGLASSGRPCALPEHPSPLPSSPALTICPLGNELGRFGLEHAVQQRVPSRFQGLGSQGAAVLLACWAAVAAAWSVMQLRKLKMHQKANVYRMKQVELGNVRIKHYSTQKGPSHLNLIRSCRPAGAPSTGGSSSQPSRWGGGGSPPTCSAQPAGSNLLSVSNKLAACGPSSSPRYKIHLLSCCKSSLDRFPGATHWLQTLPRSSLPCLVWGHQGERMHPSPTPLLRTLQTLRSLSCCAHPLG